MNAIIAFALRLRALMVALFVLVMIGGVTAFVRLNIEAYPDPVPPLVDIVTQNPGQSAEEIERYITIPIEVDVAVAPYLTAMRTISLFGLSDVKLQFTYDLTYEEAEQKVLNRLSQLPALQNQAQPTISPWSPIGEIYRYQLVGPPGYSVMDLKTLQDWVIARRFRAVPGVIDVTGWGGKTKTFEIQIDRDKLVAYGLTLPQVLQTLSNSNINVGGNTVNIGQPISCRWGPSISVSSSTPASSWWKTSFDTLRKARPSMGPPRLRPLSALEENSQRSFVRRPRSTAPSFFPPRS